MVRQAHDETLDQYFAAMRRGPEAEEELLELFSDDVVYVEPFSGAETPATGIDSVRDRLRLGWSNPLPDLELTVLSMEIVEDRAVSEWECRSSAFPGPVRGVDHVTFNAHGLISRLEVAIVDQD